VLKTAVRVYVLDASGSMHGARARFRDAILIAELNAIRVKARQNVPFDPLYFSFFNDTPTGLTRVESGQDATRHIEKLFRVSPAEGQTDITLAVMSAFDSIRLAQGRDPYLARATVVLVTDGEDGVDRELIRKTRKPFEGLDIALSFISLGEENQDLKSLVLEQRGLGGRAFYHHLSDQEITLDFRRKNAKPGTATVTLGRNDDRDYGYLGIAVQNAPWAPFTVDFNLANIGGPSAGLMFSLAVVDKLNEGNLNGGKFVAGTGTISGDGTVGPIGGITHKMSTAAEAGATEFLVPKENCNEARTVAQDTMTLIKAENLTQTVDALHTLTAGGQPPTC
jgi:hypothetical protein